MEWSPIAHHRPRIPRCNVPSQKVSDFVISNTLKCLTRVLIPSRQMYPRTGRLTEIRKHRWIGRSPPRGEPCKAAQSSVQATVSRVLAALLSPDVSPVLECALTVIRSSAQVDAGRAGILAIVSISHSVDGWRQQWFQCCYCQPLVAV